jgi:Protein of unknown function (DUF2946)
MDSILTRLRGTALRALVAWLVGFGLLFQTVVPVLAAEAKARNPWANVGVLCLAHADTAVAPSGDGSSLPSDKDVYGCCSVCALLHAAKLAVPAAAAPSIALTPTVWRRLDHPTDETLLAASAPVPYSSRAPPLTA